MTGISNGKLRSKAGPRSRTLRKCAKFRARDDDQQDRPSGHMRCPYGQGSPAQSKLLHNPALWPPDAPRRHQQGQRGAEAVMRKPHIHA
jgi:hypothetical protein